MTMSMKIQFAKTFEDADALAYDHIPIECSFGMHGSVVDKVFVMDHHGALSHMEGVALRAYRDHFGALRQAFKDGTARFVVTGAADADATFAIAALIGELPHPSRAKEFAAVAPPVLKSMTRDISDLAALVNRVDVDPIGVRLEESEDGCLLLLWNQLASSTQDSAAFYSGVDRWRSVLARRPKALLAAVKEEEALRVAKAREAKFVKISDKVVFVESEVWGFDVWYADLAPVVVTHSTHENVTLGCPDKDTSEKMFGPGGLKVVFPKLGVGWGGRESIGGSPRGEKLTREQALDAARTVANLVL